MAHLKRYGMPKSWPVPIKAEKFIIRPCPGPHKLKQCMPLQVIIRDLLGFVETAAEAKHVLNSGKILVDKIVRKNPRFPVGLMDIIEIPGIKKQYRMNVNSKGIFIEEIKPTQVASKLCMITGKKTLKGGIQQLNLHDGKNILLGKDKNSYNVRDTVVLSLPDQKIVKHYKLEKGSPAFIFSGKNIGTTGEIKEMKVRKSMTETSTVKVIAGDKEVETLMDYIFVGVVEK